MQGIRSRATAGREEGLPQSPPQRPRRSRRSAYIPAAMPHFPDAPFPAAPKPRCLVVPFAFCLRLFRLSPCPKTCHFGVPSLGKGPSAPQNKPFWGPEAGYSTLPLGKTGVFAHPWTKNRPFVGQNGHFCPSEDENQASRWAKQAFLPIRAQKSSLSLGKTGTFAHQRVGKAESDSRKWRVWAGGMSSRGAQGIQGVTQGVGLKIFLREM